MTTSKNNTFLVLGFFPQIGEWQLPRSVESKSRDDLYPGYNLTSKALKKCRLSPLPTKVEWQQYCRSHAKLEYPKQAGDRPRVSAATEWCRGPAADERGQRPRRGFHLWAWNYVAWRQETDWECWFLPQCQRAKMLGHTLLVCFPPTPRHHP